MLLAAALTLSTVTLTSCSDDSEPEIPAGPTAEESFASNYFSLDNATFVEDELPVNGNGEPISGLSMNSQALTGGMNFVTIQTEQSYRNFLVGVKGQPGYWSVNANEVSRSGSRAYNTYIIPINFGTDFGSDIIIIIIAIDNDGNASAPTEGDVTHVDSKSGDLNLNLTFSNAKDIDLHLITPAGVRIYFGNRGGYYEQVQEDGSIKNIEFGLDHDSNAVCSIDNLNNENIFIPAELIEPGEYIVQVDMWRNCDPSIATSWAIVARYKGNVITPTSGTNPAAGVYPINAGNGDHTEVMRFTLVESNSAAQAPRRSLAVKPLPMAQSAMDKLDQLSDEELSSLGIIWE